MHIVLSNQLTLLAIEPSKFTFIVWACLFAHACFKWIAISDIQRDWVALLHSSLYLFLVSIFSALEDKLSRSCIFPLLIKFTFSIKKYIKEYCWKFEFECWKSHISKEWIKWIVYKRKTYRLIGLRLWVKMWCQTHLCGCLTHLLKSLWLLNSFYGPTSSLRPDSSLGPNNCRRWLVLKFDPNPCYGAHWRDLVLVYNPVIYLKLLLFESEHTNVGLTLERENVRNSSVSVRIPTLVNNGLSE